MYAHIYHTHFDQICALGIEGELRRQGGQPLGCQCGAFTDDRSALEYKLPALLLFVDEVGHVLGSLSN